MSFRLLKAVWNVHAANITAVERLVLLNLADHANDDGQNAYPAVRTIARETSLSVRAVQDALVRLSAPDRKLIRETCRMSRRAVVYALNLDMLDRTRDAQSPLPKRRRRLRERTNDCAPRAQSEGADRARDAFHRAPDARDCAPRASHRAPGAPDPFLNPDLESSLTRAGGLRPPVDRQEVIVGLLRLRVAMVLADPNPPLGHELHAEVLRSWEADNGTVDPELVGRAIDAEMGARRASAAAPRTAPRALRDIA